VAVQPKYKPLNPVVQKTLKNPSFRIWARTITLSDGQPIL
jgi:hypothetical protein